MTQGLSEGTTSMYVFLQPYPKNSHETGGKSIVFLSASRYVQTRKTRKLFYDCLCMARMRDDDVLLLCQVMGRLDLHDDVMAPTAPDGLSPVWIVHSAPQC